MKIEINGEEIEHVYSFSIDQAFNKHHTFDCWVYADIKEKGVIYTIDGSKEWIGTMFSIDMGPGKMKFKGLVCDVTLSFNENKREMIVVRGYSPSILLETYEGHYESYSKLTLGQLLDKVKGKVTSAHLKWNINSFANKIDYITQYKESHFVFLNRLSAMFGQFFYYDGEQLHFGKPTNIKEVEMINKIDIAELELSIKALPTKFSQYHYDYLKVDTIRADAPDISLPNQLAQFAYKKSKSLFSASSNSHTETDVEDLDRLKFLQLDKRKAIASKLVCIKGKSNKSSLSIGCYAKIFKKKEKSGTEVGKFLITKIKHEYGPTGNYSNSFSGVLADTQILDVENITYPIAGQQIGIVTDSDDPERLGRVKVRLLWQNENASTNLIRVLTPYAGANERGILFIPLPGDEVIVGFHHGDPDSPFVAGSVYNRSRTPEILPEVQSITTATESKLYFFDDGKDSIVGLIDKNGNNVEINTTKNSIILYSNSTIELQSSKIEIIGDVIDIRADDLLQINAGTVSMIVESDFETSVGLSYELDAGQITEISRGDFTCRADVNVEHLAVENVTYKSDRGDITIASSKEIKFKGKRVTG
jgi:type VI secretion system secreted protein VgrG